MKKSVINEAHRILDLMGRVTLTELNQRYLDQILDKINDSGMESLSDYEKMALEKLSNDQDVEPPEIHSLDKTDELLRFTVVDQKTGQPLVSPDDIGEKFGESQFQRAYLDGAAELIAGFNQVVFIDGDMGQLDKPPQEQQIRMILPQGEYECIASGEEAMMGGYMIRLKEESDYPKDNEDEEDMDLLGLNEGDMREYKVFDSGEMNEPLDINEGNAFVGAAKKAKEEGKDSFELNGKSYKVTISKSTNEEDGFASEVDALNEDFTNFNVQDDTN